MRYSPKKIVEVLRQIEVEISNGKTTSEACKKAAIAVPTYYRWKEEFSGLTVDPAKQKRDRKQKREPNMLVVAAKIDPENLSWLQSKQKGLGPYRITRSALINTLLTYLRVQDGAGNIDLSPEALQNSLPSWGGAR